MLCRHLQLQPWGGRLGDAEGEDFTESHETASGSAQLSPAILLSHGDAVPHHLAVPPYNALSSNPNPI